LGTGIGIGGCIALGNIPWDDFESIIWLAAVEVGIDDGYIT
jgi:hypothetical protein